QTQAHELIGMTFGTALRALLRQDPDVIMVGEIRDQETARVAIQASLTGHLVLSTLHTNDAPSSITRLINIGVEPYLIGSAVNACLAQRLVRKICDHCKTHVKPDEHVAEHLALQGITLDEVVKGEGCNRCRGTGYSGRLGLYELLLINDQMRDKIAGNPNVTEFRRMCIEGGMTTLRMDGFDKVARGLTTVDEVLRVTEATI
ncbi:MAG: ATPase, T2SS/T4P/T4SS family, partial [Planctomycetota bacterium]